MFRSMTDQRTETNVAEEFDRVIDVFANVVQNVNDDLTAEHFQFVHSSEDRLSDGRVRLFNGFTVKADAVLGHHLGENDQVKKNVVRQ